MSFKTGRKCKKWPLAYVLAEYFFPRIRVPWDPFENRKKWNQECGGEAPKGPAAGAEKGTRLKHIFDLKKKTLFRSLQNIQRCYRFFENVEIPQKHFLGPLRHTASARNQNLRKDRGF